MPKVVAFVTDEELAERRRRGRDRPPSPRETAEVLRELARAVAHAHSRGVVHRELNPANVLVAGAVRTLQFATRSMAFSGRLNQGISLSTA